MFTNDLTLRARYSKNHKYLPTIIRHDAALGMNCTIVWGHEVGHRATIDAGAVVTSDIPPYALMVWVPAKQMGWVCACGQVLDKLEEGTFSCPNCGRRHCMSDSKLRED